MRHGAIAGLLASLAVLACAAPAAIAATATFDIPRLPGTTSPGETIPLLTGPLPAGDGVVYAAGRRDGSASVRFATAAAGTREVARFAPKQNASLSLYASPTRLAAIRFAYVCSDCRYMDYRTTLDSLLAGPVGGPLTPIAQCEEGQPCALTFFCGYGSTRFGAALGGELLAVRDTCTGTSCGHETSPTARRCNSVRHSRGGRRAVSSRGSSHARPRPRRRSSCATATTGAELYRSPVPPAVTFPITSLVLLPDGTVVYGLPQQSAGIPIVVATPAAPAGRVLRTVSHGSALIGAGPAGVLVARGSNLELLPLDGSVGHGFDIPDLVGTPGFDGRTITWARRTCVTTAISSWTLGTAPPPLLDLRCPTPRPSRASVTLPRDRRLGVALSCPASARGGCVAGVRLTAIRRGRLARGSNGAERSYRLGNVPVALDPGEGARAELLVPAGAARWVRRHAPLRLRVEVRSERTAVAAPAGRARRRGAHRRTARSPLTASARRGSARGRVRLDAQPALRAPGHRDPPAAAVQPDAERRRPAAELARRAERAGRAHEPRPRTTARAADDDRVPAREHRDARAVAVARQRRQRRGRALRGPRRMATMFCSSPLPNTRQAAIARPLRATASTGSATPPGSGPLPPRTWRRPI